MFYELERFQNKKANFYRQDNLCPTSLHLCTSLKRILAKPVRLLYLRQILLHICHVDVSGNWMNVAL